MRRGAVLIIVLGTLVLLALLATSFATLQGIERRVTHNYTDLVRARLAAQSGVETAIARLCALASEGWHPTWDGTEPIRRSWRYFGSCVDESNPYVLQTQNFAQLQVPLHQALNPSFANELDDPADPDAQDPSDAQCRPRPLAIEGQQVGYSGSIGGTYLRRGDLYALKVLDCQSQVNVNDGVKWGPRHSVTQNMRRVLNALGAQPEVRIAGLGDRLIDSRPPGGYTNKMELRRVLDDDVAFNRVADLLTVHSRSNPHVVNPVPLSEEEYRADIYPIFPDANHDGYFRPVDVSGRRIFRYGHGRSVWGALIDRPGRPFPLRFFDPAREPPLFDRQCSRPATFYNAVWTRDALNPQWIETVERSPVNVNTAARPVLTALTAGLEGFFEMARRRPAPANMFYDWLVHLYQYAPEGGDYGYSPGNPFLRWDCRGSEAGYLYRTFPFAAPTAAGTGVASPGIPASKIVDEILACRYRVESPNIPGRHYGVEPYGGPFRSWQQFNLFVDSLVEAGLILDPRPIFYDYRPTISPTAWYSFTYHRLTRVDLTPSTVQQRMASQAAADVLKANFNPNGHLNELNPDRNLYALVDKTDLIVHSTELCFVPLGRFEIESLGYVLYRPRPSGGTGLAAGDDALDGDDNLIAAQNRVHAVVELYTPSHETTQAQFYRGEFGERKSAPTTNNNRATESGPEPDNGVPPLECEYDGYVALPTVGGSYDQVGWSKPKGAMQTGYSLPGLYGNIATTPFGAGCSLGSGATIHSHLQFDHCAHYHAGGADRCRPIGRWPNAGEPSSVNLPDKSESPTIPGPYSPSDSAFFPQLPGRYRLCRSFAIPAVLGDATSGNRFEGATRLVPLPPGQFAWYAPSDLRIDGAYGELNSAFGYDLSSVPFSTNVTISFWAKPNFFPECTGRARTFVSMLNQNEWFRFPGYYRYGIWINRLLPVSLHYFPGAFAEDPWRPNYMNSTRFNHFLWAMGSDGLNGALPVGGFGLMTPTLNHEFEPRFAPGPGETPRPGRMTYAGDRFASSTDSWKWNWLRDHEWVHVTIRADSGNANRYYYWSGHARYNEPVQRLGMLINGRDLGNEQISVHMNDTWPSMNFDMQGKSIRFGGEYADYSRQIYSYPGWWGTVQTLGYRVVNSNVVPRGTYVPFRQYFADATIDEIYYCRDDPNALRSSQNIFRRGRYYRPLDPAPDTEGGDGIFASQPVTIARPRGLAAGNGVSPSGFGDTVLRPAPLFDRRMRVKAVAWSALAEDVGWIADAGGRNRLRPVMYDWSNPGAPRAMSPDRGSFVAPDGRVGDKNGLAYETVAQMFVAVDRAAGGRTVYGPYHNEAWSPVLEGHQPGVAATGGRRPVELSPGDSVRTIVKLRPGAAVSSGTVLLSAPVLDDVTLFFEHDPARFVSYVEVMER
jgi:hypothetical protein